MTLRSDAQDMAALARDAVALMAPVAARKGVVLTVTPSLDACVVWADRRRVSQILHNLLGNAVKHGVDCVVTVSMARVGAMLDVRVSDGGPGMSEEAIRLALTPFASARMTTGEDGREGHGLGLSIVKAMVELHGGALAIDSAPGAGATVRFTLPLADADGAGPLAAASSGPVA
jgi:signal transduction histidine kinase